MRRWSTVSIAVATAVLALGGAPAWGADGDLDTSFDGDGKLSAAAPSAHAGARQSTGKYVTAHMPTQGQLAITRRTSTGAPDNTWGGDGTVEVAVPGFEFVLGMGVQSDDKVVVMGGGSGTAVVLRLTSGGIPDTTYDGDGRRVTPIPGSANARDAVLDSSGRAVFLAQTSGYAIVLVRHTATGGLDGTFSGDGVAEDAYSTLPSSLAAAPAGKLAASGYRMHGQGFAARYASTGAPDTTFDGDGHREFMDAPMTTKTAVDSSGRVIVALPSSGAVKVRRFTAAGAPDATFGTSDGAATVSALTSVAALAVQPDGKVLLGGGDSSSSFKVMRLTAGGAPDAAWAPGGAVTTSFTGNAILTELIVQPDKRVVAFGSDGGDLAIARYIGGVTPDTTKPTVRITPPTTTTGAVSFAFSEDVRGVTASNLVLRVTGQTANVPGTLSCKSAAGAAVRCDGSVRTASLAPAARLTPGQRYAAMANPPGVATTIKDPAGNVLNAASAPFRLVSIGEADAAIGYEWAPVTATQAKGGSFRQELTTGASMTLTYTGSSAAAYVVKGPKFGIAKVTIDGGAPIDVDLYAAELQYGQMLPLMLGQGTHTIKMEVSGRKNAAASGFAVNLDAFQNGSAAIQNDPVVRSQWQSLPAGAASAGRYVNSAQGGSRATMTFRGTSVAWRTLTGPGQGQARVFIDGVQRGPLIDNYATSAAFLSRTFSGLSDGVHTIRVVPAGTKNAAATGFGVAVDSFLVG